jgi:hypothetical protein
VVPVHRLDLFDEESFNNKDLYLIQIFKLQVPSATKIVTLESLYRGSIFQSVRNWIPDQNHFGNDRFGNWLKIDTYQVMI